MSARLQQRACGQKISGQVVHAAVYEASQLQNSRYQHRERNVQVCRVVVVLTVLCLNFSSNSA